MGTCLVLAGCSGGADAPAPDPEDQLAADCASAVETLLVRTQEYLDGVARSAGPEAGPTPSAGPQGGDDVEAYSAALADVRQYAVDRGCDPRRFQEDLADGLRGLQAGGPVAGAVLRQLQADAVPGGPDLAVAAGEDLAAVVASAATGAVVELGPGVHRLPETLVLLRGVTLRGAGRDSTTVTASAPEGVLLVLTAEPVAVEGVALVQEDAGAVVSAGPGSRLAVRAARVSGARAAADGSGGVGVLMASGAAGQTGPVRTTTLEADDLHAVDNAVAGVLLAGDHRAEVRGALLERNGQCGVCFFGTSDGTVVDSRFEDNAVGVVAAGRATPGVRGGTARGGEVGVQAVDDAAPQVEGLTASGASTSSFFFADRSRGAVRGSTCTDVPAGIVVSPSASPELGDNPGCTVARGQ